MSNESPRLTNEELRDMLAVLSTWDEHAGGYCDDVLDQLSVTFNHATGTPSLALGRRNGPEVRMALTPETTAVLKAALKDRKSVV